MEELHNSASFAESDEEDYEIYFLQPASSPYNIKEKLEKANRDLFEENPDLSSRPLRIKFREELVEYEPDLTDDDVQSIESYNETIDYNFIEQQSQNDNFPYNIPTKLELNIFPPSAINEDEEDYNEDEEEEEEEILADAEQVDEERENDDEDLNEEIQEDDDVDDDNDEDDISEEIVIDEALGNEVNDSNTSDTVEEEIEESDRSDFNMKTTRKRGSTSKSSATNSKNSSPNQSKREKTHIDCKTHCIEKLELELPISKLQICERPVCPTLKLQKRKCCEKNHAKNEQRLPCYTGLRSEYGLSQAQMEKRERKKELTKLREEKRRQLLEEYKQRKVQQNEEIFRQWLKNIEKRRQEQAKKISNNNKKCLSPTIFHFPNKINKERPKTTNNAMPNRTVKRRKRPHTTSACVFIEVPPNLLKRGIQVGNLLVTRPGGNVPAKNLHLLTLN